MPTLREITDPDGVRLRFGFDADGAPVLLWKRERPAAIVAQPLTPDGLGVAAAFLNLWRFLRRLERE